MTLAGTESIARPSTAAPRLALAVADANWFTTENLFGDLERPDVASLLLHCADVVNALQAGRPPWRWGGPTRRSDARQWRRAHVLPPGWMKRWPRLGMRPIARSVRDWHRSIGPGVPLALVMTYPYYLYLRDQLRPDVAVYMNLDDYGLYWPGRAAEVDRLERRAVLESDLTVCVAHARAERLREAVPEAASRIVHLPHGTPEAFLPTLADAPDPPADLAALPGPRLGYVGGLADRIDWPLLDRVAASFPDASIVLVGRTPPPGAAPWKAEARRCLARPNVHALGWRPQRTLGAYIHAFDACLIPYRVDHPFNRSCCPTKIMDYMGGGRPIVATDLPECRRFGHLFDVASDPAGFVDALGRLIADGFDDGRSEARCEWALENRCGRVASRFVDRLYELLGPSRLAT